MTAIKEAWTEGDSASVPYWVYTDSEVYQKELERVWYGDHWLYTGLACEVPEVGSYRTLVLGERPVIMVRSRADEISVLENRCAHKGTKVVWERAGRAQSLTCPYHRWNYALDGQLKGLPFRRGIDGQGGMQADFQMGEHNLNRLKVETVNGVVWASFGNPPPLREFLGPVMWQHYERIFSGRKLRLIGYNRQRLHGNWKLMMENNKDAYHGALLHAFFATFGLFRPDQKSALDIDATGRHSCLSSAMAGGGANAVAAALPGFDASLQLQDRRLIEAVKELRGDETMGSSTIFPSVILLQQVNSLQARQLVPRGPGCFDLMWTHFGFEDDDEEMRKRRLRNANLFGPAGFVSADDAEVIRMQQQGFEMSAAQGAAVNLLGGRAIERSTSMANEAPVRGMYAYYRQLMGL